MAFVQATPELVVNSGTSGNLVFPGNTTAGNLIVFLVASLTNAVVNFTCSGFTIDKTHSNTNTGGGIQISSQAGITGGTTTYAISTVNASHDFRAIAYEFSGMATASYVDVSGSNTDDTTSSPTATPSPGLTSTTAGVWVMGFTNDRTLGSMSATGYTGTTSTASGSNAYQGFFAYKVSGSTVSGERGALTASAGTHYEAAIVAYKASGATAKLFRTNPSGNLSGLGSSGPFFQNPLQ